MSGGVKMLSRVLVLGGIAAADVTADPAETKMHPAVAHFEALLAAFGMRLFIGDLIGVLTCSGHSL